MRLTSILALAALSLAGTVSAHAMPGSLPADRGGAPILMVADLIDINSASKAELMTLPGIGDARADAIIKGRPYKGKDELVQKKIITDGVYQPIKDKIIAKQK
jgi:radical SAM superfamily enzyme with C-terminal helix-hairpin-helix motif